MHASDHETPHRGLEPAIHEPELLLASCACVGLISARGIRCRRMLAAIGIALRWSTFGLSKHEFEICPAFVRGGQHGRKRFDLGFARVAWLPHLARPAVPANEETRPTQVNLFGLKAIVKIANALADLV
jgi:hypothetical protein